MNFFMWKLPATLKRLGRPVIESNDVGVSEIIRKTSSIPAFGEYAEKHRWQRFLVLETSDCKFHILHGERVVQFLKDR